MQEYKNFCDKKKLKILFCGISDLNGEEMFYERELQKTNQTEFRIEEEITKRR